MYVCLAREGFFPGSINHVYHQESYHLRLALAGEKLPAESNHTQDISTMYRCVYVYLFINLDILIVFFFGSDFSLDSDSWPKNIHIVPIPFVIYTASCPIPAPVIESLRCVLQMFLKGLGFARWPCLQSRHQKSKLPTTKGTGVTYSPIRFDFMSCCMSLTPRKPPETLTLTVASS